MLLLAGLDNQDDLPPREAPLTPEDAAALYDLLLDKPVTLPRFAPRLVTASLLREVMEAEEELSRGELLQRVERFRGLAVLQPNGYLVWALTGEPQQRVAPVEWKAGAFRALAFEVGRFYSGRNGMAFFAVDEQLREKRSAGVLAEVYDDADVISRVLDGAEESLVELAVALGRMVVHPIDSAAELAQMPETLAALIKNSPEYLEHFRQKTRGEQIEALSKLATTLLSTYGAAGGTTRTVTAAGRGLETVPLGREVIIELVGVAGPFGIEQHTLLEAVGLPLQEPGNSSSKQDARLRLPRACLSVGMWRRRRQQTPSRSY